MLTCRWGRTGIDMICRNFNTASIMAHMCYTTGWWDSKWPGTGGGQTGGRMEDDLPGWATPRSLCPSPSAWPPGRPGMGAWGTRTCTRVPHILKLNLTKVCLRVACNMKWGEPIKPWYQYLTPDSLGIVTITLNFASVLYSWHATIAIIVLTGFSDMSL